MAVRTLVRDGRLQSTVVLDRIALARINELVESRQQAQARTVYLALVEASEDPNGWTRKMLTERAGVGAEIFDRAIGTLVALGLLRRDGDSIWLGTSAVARETIPEIEPTPIPERASERAQKFWEFHAQTIAGIGNSKPPRSEKQLRAAERILEIESDAKEIKARLEYALGHRFYADKVLVMESFARWYPKINAAFRADRSQEARRPTERPDVAPARRVSYESGRVEVVL